MNSNAAPKRQLIPVSIHILTGDIAGGCWNWQVAFKEEAFDSVKVIPGRATKERRVFTTSVTCSEVFDPVPSLYDLVRACRNGDSDLGHFEINEEGTFFDLDYWVLNDYTLQIRVRHAPYIDKSWHFLVDRQQLISELYRVFCDFGKRGGWDMTVPVPPAETVRHDERTMLTDKLSVDGDIIVNDKYTSYKNMPKDEAVHIEPVFNMGTAVEGCVELSMVYGDPAKTAYLTFFQYTDSLNQAFQFVYDLADGLEFASFSTDDTIVDACPVSSTEFMLRIKKDDSSLNFTVCKVDFLTKLNRALLSFYKQGGWGLDMSAMNEDWK